MDLRSAMNTIRANVGLSVAALVPDLGVSHRVRATKSIIPAGMNLRSDKHTIAANVGLSVAALVPDLGGSLRNVRSRSVHLRRVFPSACVAGFTRISSGNLCTERSYAASFHTCVCFRQFLFLLHATDLARARRFAPIFSLRKFSSLSFGVMLLSNPSFQSFLARELRRSRREGNVISSSCYPCWSISDCTPRRIMSQMILFERCCQ